MATTKEYHDYVMESLNKAGIMIVTGKTCLPAWSCFFNTLIIIIPLLPTKFASKGNIAGAIMFLGLFIML